MQMNKGTRGVAWSHYVDNNFYDSEGFGGSIAYTVRDAVLPMISQVNTVFDTALRGEFDYKHDLLMSGKHIHLIQSRVASRKTTQEDEVRQFHEIGKLKKQGIPIVTTEIGLLDQSIARLGHTPHILRLQNLDHMGAIGTESLVSLDLRAMKGLILPEGLRGGLLQHCGYNVIAYALYWGIPVMFN